MRRFREKPKNMGTAQFHKQILEDICRTRIPKLIKDFYQTSDIEDPLCVFKEPLFTTRGAYLPDERYKGERIVSPDIVIIHHYKNWHMLFVELKARPFKGEESYIEKTEISFRLLYQYILDYPKHIYALFRYHTIPGRKDKVPRHVIESSLINFLGIYRKKSGKIGMTLSCDLPTLPELLDEPDRYPLIFRYY